MEDINLNGGGRDKNKPTPKSNNQQILAKSISTPMTKISEKSARNLLKGIHQVNLFKQRRNKTKPISQNINKLLNHSAIIEKKTLIFTELLALRLVNPSINIIDEINRLCTSGAIQLCNIEYTIDSDLNSSCIIYHKYALILLVLNQIILNVMFLDELPSIPGLTRYEYIKTYIDHILQGIDESIKDRFISDTISLLESKQNNIPDDDDNLYKLEIINYLNINTTQKYVNILDADPSDYYIGDDTIGYITDPFEPEYDNILDYDTHQLAQDFHVLDGVDKYHDFGNGSDRTGVINCYENNIIITYLRNIIFDVIDTHAKSLDTTGEIYIKTSTLYTSSLNKTSVMDLMFPPNNQAHFETGNQGPGNIDIYKERDIVEPYLQSAIFVDGANKILFQTLKEQVLGNIHTRWPNIFNNLQTSRVNDNIKTMMLDLRMINYHASDPNKPIARQKMAQLNFKFNPTTNKNEPCDSTNIDTVVAVTYPSIFMEDCRHPCDNLSGLCNNLACGTNLGDAFRYISTNALKDKMDGASPTLANNNTIESYGASINIYTEQPYNSETKIVSSKHYLGFNLKEILCYKIFGRKLWYDHFNEMICCWSPIINKCLYIQNPSVYNISMNIAEIYRRIRKGIITKVYGDEVIYILMCIKTFSDWNQGNICRYYYISMRSRDSLAILHSIMIGAPIKYKDNFYNWNINPDTNITNNNKISGFIIVDGNGDGNINISNLINLQTGAPITPYLKISNYVDDVVADWAPDSFFINANDRIAYTKYLKYKYKYLKAKGVDTKTLDKILNTKINNHDLKKYKNKYNKYKQKYLNLVNKK